MANCRSVFRILKRCSSTSTAPTIITSIENGIATITLNNPTKLNALTESLGDDFHATVTRLGSSPTLRAVILTGAGKAFSAGGDLAFLEDRTRSPPLANAERMRAFYKRFLSIRSLPVPVIAAING
jgi:enoyl-CoA hydratase/carnithine racemase